MMSSAISARQPLDHLDDHAALGRGHAGRRLVEQQHLGLEAERHGDLDQALAAIGQLAHRPQRLVGDAEPLEQRERLLDHGAARAGRPEQCRRRRHAARRPRASRSRARDRPRKSVVIWKVRTRPRLTRCACARWVMSLPSSRMRPALGCERAGHQIDEGGLAGAVGADERVARAALEAEIDVVGDAQRAEALRQAVRLERRPSLIGRSPPRARA